MGGARNFREYPVGKEAVDYATFVYEVTGKLPWFEKKGLCDQLERAVVSISSNIAKVLQDFLMQNLHISWILHLVLLLKWKPSC